MRLMLEDLLYRHKLPAGRCPPRAAAVAGSAGDNQPARTHIRAKDKLPAGKVRIEVETSYVERKPAGPLKVVLKVNGREAASGVVPVSAPLAFTANDGLDFGIDLGSPVGLEYYDQAPFKFNGKIEQARVEYIK